MLLIGWKLDRSLMFHPVLVTADQSDDRTLLCWDHVLASMGHEERITNDLHAHRGGVALLGVF